MFWKTQGAVIRRCSVKRCSKIFCKIHRKHNFAGVSFLTKLQVGNLKSAEAAAGDFAKFCWKNSVFEYLFNEVGVLKACSFIKKTLTQVFSCELFNELFKNNHFEEHLWTSASKHLKRDSNLGASCEFCKLFKNTYFLEGLQTACSETPVRGICL